MTNTKEAKPTRAGFVKMVMHHLKQAVWMRCKCAPCRRKKAQMDKIYNPDK